MTDATQQPDPIPHELIDRVANVMLPECSLPILNVDLQKMAAAAIRAVREPIPPEMIERVTRAIARETSDEAIAIAAIRAIRAWDYGNGA